MLILTYLAIFCFGTLIGNFATPVFYRLPRNITIFGDQKTGRPPHCASCQHLLRFYEYLPIFSWVSARGSCNYCGVKINPYYFFIEIAGGLLALLCAYLYGNNIELFFLKFCFCLNLILSIALYSERKKLFPSIIVGLIVEAAILTTWQEQNIINWLGRFSGAIIISSLLLKIRDEYHVRLSLIATILPASIFLLSLAEFGCFALVIIINNIFALLTKIGKNNIYISNSLIMLIFFLT